MAFGKRMRIANAIADLRRPPSVGYSDHQSLPSQLHQSNPPSHSHSRTQSQSLSLPGTTPGTTPVSTTVGHVHSYTIQNSTAGVAAGMSAAAGVGLGIALSPVNAAPSEVSSFRNLCPLYIFTFAV